MKERPPYLQPVPNNTPKESAEVVEMPPEQRKALNAEKKAADLDAARVRAEEIRKQIAHSDDNVANIGNAQADKIEGISPAERADMNDELMGNMLTTWGEEQKRLEDRKKFVEGVLERNASKRDAENNELEQERTPEKPKNE